MVASTFKLMFLYFIWSIISFSFLHLDCVSQRTYPNLLMASLKSNCFLFMLNVWLVTSDCYVQMDKTKFTAALAVAISSAWVSLHCPLSRMGDKWEKERLLYAVRSGRLPWRDPSRKGMYSIDLWREWNGTITTGEKTIFLVILILCFLLVFLFLVIFLPLQLPSFNVCRIFQCLW